MCLVPTNVYTAFRLCVIAFEKGNGLYVFYYSHENGSFADSAKKKERHSSASNWPIFTQLQAHQFCFGFIDFIVDASWCLSSLSFSSLSWFFHSSSPPSSSSTSTSSTATATAATTSRTTTGTAAAASSTTVALVIHPHCTNRYVDLSSRRLAER